MEFEHKAATHRPTWRADNAGRHCWLALLLVYITALRKSFGECVHMNVLPVWVARLISRPRGRADIGSHFVTYDPYIAPHWTNLWSTWPDFSVARRIYALHWALLFLFNFKSFNFYSFQFSVWLCRRFAGTAVHVWNCVHCVDGFVTENSVRDLLQ